MKQEKGQGLVEFAVVFPVIICFVFAIIYSGMLFHDYSTISSLVRSAVREAAIMTELPEDNRYRSIEARYSAQADTVMTSLYKKDFLKIEQTDETKVTGVFQASLHEPTSYVMRMVLPQTYQIRYAMRKESRP